MCPSVGVDDDHRSCQVSYLAIESLAHGNRSAYLIRCKPYQVQDGHLHHALVEIRRPVLDDLDGNHLLRFQILALDDLAKSTLSKHVQYEISVPVKT